MFKRSMIGLTLLIGGITTLTLAPDVLAHDRDEHDAGGVFALTNSPEATRSSLTTVRRTDHSAQPVRIRLEVWAPAAASGHKAR